MIRLAVALAIGSLLCAGLAVTTACSKRADEQDSKDGSGQAEKTTGMKPAEGDEVPEDVRTTMELLAFDSDTQKAIKKLEEIVRRYPRFIEARLNLGALLLQSGQPEQARKAYQRVLDDFEGELGALAGLATVESSLGHHDRAKKLAEQAIQGGYRWAPGYEVVGDAAVAAGDKSAAAEAYLTGYRLSPHAWLLLEKYCKLKGRKFTPPTEDGLMFLAEKQLQDLVEFVDKAMVSPKGDGAVPGCDHTFRFAEEWAAKRNIDVIDLYQFLNAHGGFCDCEIVLNVTTLLEDDP